MSGTQTHHKFEQLGRVADVAEWLGVTRQAVYKFAREGRIPHYRVGKALVFDRAELEKWLEDNRGA